MGRVPVLVGVVSRHEVVRRGLVAMLGDAPDRLTVVPGNLLNGTPPESVDVVLYDAIGLDDAHGDATGKELERLVRAGVPVIAVDRVLRPDLGARAAELGAVATITMGASTRELVHVVEAAMRPGGGLLLEAVAARIRARHGHDDAGHWQNLVRHGLTTREVQILAMIAGGATNPDIAGRLHLSVNTIKTAIRSAYRKIGVTRRSEAVAWCLQHGVAARHEDGTAVSPGSRVETDPHP